MEKEELLNKMYRLSRQGKRFSDYVGKEKLMCVYDAGRSWNKEGHIVTLDEFHEDTRLVGRKRHHVSGYSDNIERIFDDRPLLLSWGLRNQERLLNLTISCYLPVSMIDEEDLFMATMAGDIRPFLKKTRSAFHAWKTNPI